VSHDAWRSLIARFVEATRDDAESHDNGGHFRRPKHHKDLVDEGLVLWNALDDAGVSVLREAIADCWTMLFVAQILSGIYTRDRSRRDVMQFVLRAKPIPEALFESVLFASLVVPQTHFIRANYSRKFIEAAMLSFGYRRCATFYINYLQTSSNIDNEQFLDIIPSLHPPILRCTNLDDVVNNDSIRVFEGDYSEIEDIAAEFHATVRRVIYGDRGR
jgi:hypothetical protein